jgi:cell division protein FtsB
MPAPAANRCRVNPALIDKLAWCGMVTRKRLRRIVNTLALYPLAALLIGYFGVNAYNGDRGLKAKEDIERQMATLNAELDRLKAEQAQWERRIALLKSDDLDPDMLDERARTLLDYADPHDLTLMLNRPSLSAAAPRP